MPFILPQNLADRFCFFPFTSNADFAVEWKYIDNATVPLSPRLSSCATPNNLFAFVLNPFYPMGFFSLEKKVTTYNPFPTFTVIIPKRKCVWESGREWKRKKMILTKASIFLFSSSLPLCGLLFLRSTGNYSVIQIVVS